MKEFQVMIPVGIGMLVISIITGFYFIPIQIQEEIEKQNQDKPIMELNVVTKEIRSPNGTTTYFISKVENQTYQGHFIVEPDCMPMELDTIIIKENCDLDVKYMEISDLIKFIKEHPKALTQNEQDVLISKAVGNTIMNEIDLEVEMKASAIMWRLIQEGLY